MIPHRDLNDARPPPETWDEAGRLLSARILGLLAYEGVLQVDNDDGGSELSLFTRACPGIAYRFTAKRGSFGSLHVRPNSIVRETAKGSEAVVDPLRLMIDIREHIGLGGPDLVGLARQVLATRTADAPSLSMYLESL